MANQSPPTERWQLELSELLARAAGLCIEHDLDVEALVNGAWSAYLAARPGLREYLEEQQLLAQLDELRRIGKIASA